MKIDISTIKIILQHPKYRKKVQWLGLTGLILCLTLFFAFKLLISPNYNTYRISKAKYRILVQKTKSLNIFEEYNFHIAIGEHFFWSQVRSSELICGSKQEKTFS